jgi:hypothetical protein
MGAQGTNNLLKEDLRERLFIKTRLPIRFGDFSAVLCSPYCWKG